MFKHRILSSYDNYMISRKKKYFIIYYILIETEYSGRLRNICLFDLLQISSIITLLVSGWE